MRLNILALLALGLGIGLLAACASRDSAVSQTQRPSGQASQLPGEASQVPAATPADTAPRISVEELHKLYEKGDVLIIDTRSEIAFKESRIKGAILVPVSDVAAKADELPRNKMIVTYCT